MSRLSDEIREELAGKISLGEELNYKDKRLLQTPQDNPRKPREIEVTYIKKVREALGISAYELSKISGVSAGSLSKFENDSMNITLNQLKKLSRAMGVPIDALVYGNAEIIDEQDSNELIELRLLKNKLQKLLTE